MNDEYFRMRWRMMTQRTPEWVHEREEREMKDKNHPLNFDKYDPKNPPKGWEYKFDGKYLCWSKIFD